MQSIDQLKDEVLAIIDQLSRDELRVVRFMGRRMIDIGHAKYGALDLAKHDRIWSREMAQESSDRLFYAQCQEIAAEDARASRVNEFRLANSITDSALSDFVSAAPDAAPSPGGSSPSGVATFPEPVATFDVSDVSGGERVELARVKEVLR